MELVAKKQKTDLFNQETPLKIDIIYFKGSNKKFLYTKLPSCRNGRKKQ